MTKKTKKAIIFGTGHFGEVVHFYLTHDSEYEIIAFTADADNLPSQFCDKPVISFDDIEKKYSPNDYEMFIAVGARKMNLLRQNFCQKARDKGYTLLSYICSKAICWEKDKIGDNVFIFEGNVIQPFVSIGDGTILWSGNHIGHHSQIGSYCFITSHAVISGHCKIGDRSFIGVNATLHDNVQIEKENLISAHAYIQKDTTDKAVYLAETTKKFAKESKVFFK